MGSNTSKTSRSPAEEELYGEVPIPVNIDDPEIDRYITYSHTKLTVACDVQDVSAVRQLLEAGANPNKPRRFSDKLIWSVDRIEKHNYNPLSCALYFGNIDIIKLLLKHGANINDNVYYRYNDKHISLMHNNTPVSYFHIIIYKIITIDGDCDIDKQNNYLTIFNLFIEHGINIDILKSINIINCISNLEQHVYKSYSRYYEENIRNKIYNNIYNSSIFAKFIKQWHDLIGIQITENHINTYPLLKPLLLEDHMNMLKNTVPTAPIAEAPAEIVEDNVAVAVVEPANDM